MKPDSISQTAAHIAIKFYGLTRMQPYRSWFDPETVLFYNRLVQSLPFPLNRYHSLLKKSWLRKLFIFSEELLLPGDIMHILMRKYYIARELERLLEEGAEQLVVLGAGFDHLAVIYSGRDIPSFEFDMPGMADLKEEFAKTYDYKNSNLSISRANFTRNELHEDLENAASLVPSRNTVVVAEGLFDYLSPDETSQILSQLNQYFDKELNLITTMFALDELPPFRRLVFKSGVSLVGETLKLDLSRPAFFRFLHKNQFRITNLIDHNSMEKHPIGGQKPTFPVLEGFYLATAEKN